MTNGPKMEKLRQKNDLSYQEYLGKSKYHMKNSMFKKLALTICALHLSVSPAHAGLEDTYLCVAEQSTGFAKEDGVWNTAKFKVDEIKYILKPVDKSSPRYDKSVPFSATEIGKDKPDYLCRVFSKKYPFGLYCLSNRGSLTYSSETGNYIRTNTTGYWTKEYDTPHIERGKCSKL
ncbi:hypothetical protein [Sessilibacter corallicola]|uniref:hypothetical protein n=1 Tax=Sessilibacter corallicola TaxID=2904075 RepID=UPI001E49673F|nr:hypothetical protein [Sessilibacter corallicola]MCE2029295.1 hypothetical protein [Sessilibacter corallicola]